MACILVVDDDPSVLAVAEEALRLQGYCVSTARGGREAQKALLSMPVALVVTDLFMPDMDGFELIRAIRASNPGMPVLAISGYGEATRSDANFLAYSETLGADMVLEKPLRPAVLLEKVAQCLE